MIDPKKKNLAIAAALSAAVVFLYATILSKLARDWWTDENYSHGLLVPFIIAFIVSKEWDSLRRLARPSFLPGGIIIGTALLLLFVGTLGSELFTQRISLVVMLAGIVVYLLGARVLTLLAVPFILLLLAIPIPQIIFNRIAFPLQILASQIAVWGIRLFEIPTLRKGNVIDILPNGATQTISLEVVEACSGIRSLMTLITLALVLAYFTRRFDGERFANMSARDVARAVILMIVAVPIAVLTNAGRVTATGILTFYHGKQATGDTVHDLSGWTVFVVALGLLIAANFVLMRVLAGGESSSHASVPALSILRLSPAVPLIVALLTGGIAVNWFVTRGESEISRRPLAELPTTLGEWDQKGGEIRFDDAVSSVLRTTDYTMREYRTPDGRIANIYVGYYASQRTGSTYHSPQNCLPGAGWVMTEPQYIEIPTADGRTFAANRYVIENGIYKEVMIYWYQGRGRVEASEYADKLNTIVDSVTRRRSDGAMVRVITSVGNDEAAAVAAAVDLSGRLADALPPHVPQ